MSGLFGAASKFVGRAQSKNLMEAIASAGVHVANADGNIDRQEGEAIITSLLNVPKIKANYEPHQLREPIETFIDIVKASPMQGRQRFRKEILEVAGDHENALIVAAAAYDVGAKGGLSEQDKVAIREVFDWAGVRPQELALPENF